MAYTYEQVFAADPSNPSNVAQNASITIFAPGDGTMTPLTITDPDGQPLANPIPVNANGFGSAFAHATLDRVAWAGGGFTGFFTSYEGMKGEAVAAREAAEQAAATAGADAAAVATAAIGTATEDAAASAASAATAAANASASAAAAIEAAGLVGAPADTAIAAAFAANGSETKTALTTAFGSGSFPSPRLVLAGDSLTDYEDSVSGAGSQWSPRGPWTWALLYMNQRLDVVKNAGIAGNTSTALLARYDTDVIAYNPGVVSLLIGTNDPAAAIPLATTQANITAMLDKNRAAGAVTVIRTIPPQDADDTTKKNFRIQLNNWIKTLAFRHDVIVVDIMPLVVEPTNGNFATGMAYDGVHFGALGAEKIGKKLSDVLTPLLPAWDRLPSSPSDPDNALTNGWMVGDGATYHESTGWSFSGAGITLSKVARTDGVNGQWQQVTTVAAEATQKLNRTITLAGSGLAVGDTVQAFTEFETDATNWGSVSQFHIVAIAKNGGTPTWYAYSMLSQGSDHWPAATFRASKGVFATPKFVIPANSTVIEFRLVFNGIGTVRWGRSVVKKV